MDDEEMIRFTVKAQLETVGYSVLTAERGAGALELVGTGEREPESDYQRHDHAGNERKGTFCRTPEKGLPLPFLVISGYTRDDNLDEMMRAGCERILQKPFSFKELTEQLDKILHRRTDRQ